MLRKELTVKKRLKFPFKFTNLLWLKEFLNFLIKVWKKLNLKKSKEKTQNYIIIWNYNKRFGWNGMNIGNKEFNKS